MKLFMECLVVMLLLGVGAIGACNYFDPEARRARLDRGCEGCVHECATRAAGACNPEDGFRICLSITCDSVCEAASTKESKK